MCSDWTTGLEAGNHFIVFSLSECSGKTSGDMKISSPQQRTKPYRDSVRPPKMHCEQGRVLIFFVLFQHFHPDVQTLFLCITLLVEHTLKTCIKQGANKSNYGRLVGRSELGSRSGVVFLHICLHVHKSGQEKPQRFMGLITLHSTQGMFNCGSFLFSAVVLGMHTLTAMSF